MNRRVDISYKTVIFITLFFLGLKLLFIIHDVILLLFIAIIFMSALSPIVEKLVHWKLPRSLAILLTYIVGISSLVSLTSLVIYPLAEQVPNLLVALPAALKRTFPALIDEGLIQRELGNLSRNAVGFLGFTITVFSNIIKVIFVAFMTFYLLLQKDAVETLLSKFFVGKEERTKKLILRIEYKLGAWVRGQMTLSLLIGLIVYAMLFYLKIPFALSLAILAGLLEVVPVFGPIIAAIPAIALAYTLSWPLALTVAAGFLIIQQLENNLIVPKVMQRAVGLNPLVVILAIAIGERLLGVAGALLAVPTVVVLQLIAEEILGKELG